MSKHRVITIALAVAASAIVIGYLRKSAQQDPAKAADSIAGKLGLV